MYTLVRDSHPCFVPIFLNNTTAHKGIHQIKNIGPRPILHIVPGWMRGHWVVWDEKREIYTSPKPEGKIITKRAFSLDELCSFVEQSRKNQSQTL